MPIALLLCSALGSPQALGAARQDEPSRQRRIQQYIDGFRQIADLVRRIPGYDVFSMDNTIAPDESVESVDGRMIEALEAIPTLQAKIHFWDNDLGRGNKGSGLVIQWQHTLPSLLSRYEYVVHYEPRQSLMNDSFFETVAAAPGNYFCFYRDLRKLAGFTLRLPRIWTGMFAMRTADLLQYASANDRGVPPRAGGVPWWWGRYRDLRSRFLPGWMAALDECIEADLPHYLRRHGIPYTRVDNLGARWHEEATDKWHDMIACDRWP